MPRSVRGVRQKGKKKGEDRPVKVAASQLSINSEFEQDFSLEKKQKGKCNACLLNESTI